MKFRNIITLFMTAFVAVTCTNDQPFNKQYNIPEGFAQVRLFIHSGDFQIPVTRSLADENMVDSNPWVFVFRGSGDNAIFFEVIQATSSGGESNVILTESSNDSRIWVIANPPESFHNGSATFDFNKANLTAQLSGKTFADAVNSVLLTTLLDAPLQTTVPYTPNQLVPMSNILDVSQIDNTTSIGTLTNKFLLRRIVAKVTVTNQDANFSLQGVALINAPMNGRLFQSGSSLKANTGNQTDYLTSTAGDGVTGISPADGINNNASPIYLYESRANENTSIIVKGKYAGTDYYYRLAFIDTNSNHLDILRNHHYEFIIHSIDVTGYATVSEAISAPPSNIESTVTDTDLYTHDLMDNGQGYLGVSNSECIIYGNPIAETNILVSVVVNNVPPIVPKGNITLASVPANSMTNWGSSDIGTGGILNTTYVRLNLSASFLNGTVLLKLANMSKELPISRRAAISAAGGSIEFAGNFVSGIVTSQGTGGPSWLSLADSESATGENQVTRPNTGSIFLKVTPSGGIPRTNGEVFLSRDNQQGVLKLIISQN